MKNRHLSVKRLNMCRWCLCLALLAAAAGLPAAGADETESAATIRSALLAAGRNALKQSDIASAVFYYTRYLQQQPDDRVIALEFAGILTHAGRFDEALELCDRILADDPANAEALKLRAVALGRLGRPGEALRIMEELRLRFPDDVELQKIEAGFRALHGDRRFSQDLYRELLISGFNNVQDWQDYLGLLAADEQWTLLLEAYEQHRVRLSANDNVRLAVLAARLARNEWPEIRSLYDQLEHREPRLTAAVMIADRLAAAGRLDEAVEFLAPALDPQAPDPNMVAKLALMHAYRHRPELALDLLEDVPPALRNMRLDITRAKIFWAAGRPGEAWRELDRLELPPHNIEAVLARAGLLYDLEREWEIPPLLAGITADLRTAAPADRRLAWCLTALAHVRFGDWEAARRTTAVFRRQAPADLAPDIIDVMIERAARRPAAYTAALARLGARLRDYQPGMELIRPALMQEVPAAAWRMAHEARPTNRHVLMRLAAAEEHAGNMPEAMRLYETAGGYPETRAEALLGLANCALRMQDQDRIRKMAPLLDDEPMEFADLIRGARLMLRAGLDGPAEAFLARIAPAHGDHVETRAARAAWLLRNHREQEARRLLAVPEPDGPAQLGLLLHMHFRLATLARDADDPVYRVAAGRLLDLAHLSLALGDLDGILPAVDVRMLYDRHAEARELLEEADRRHPRDLRVLDRLMTAYIKAGDYDAAERMARQVLVRRPGDADRRGLLARMCVWRSDYRLAWRRYEELLADYPEDDLFRLEFDAKRNLALGRHRRAAKIYAGYANLRPADREMVVEEGDVWFMQDLSRAAADRYRAAGWTFPEDRDIQRAQATAERQAHWGVQADAGYEHRQGRDRKVDLRRNYISGGVRFPRGPDGMTLEAGLGLTRLRFDDPADERLDARMLTLRGRWIFTNGVDVAAGFQGLDYSDLDSAWRAAFDAGYRGLDGWKVALIGGREDVRDNYYTILDGLQRSWIGGYGQWQPTTRLEFFGQYRVFDIDAPSRDAPLPADRFGPTNAVTAVGRTAATNTVDRVTPGTWERNFAYEGVLEASCMLLFFPRSLRLWVNGYLYRTEKQSDMYWTPDGAFMSGQVGLHWRHTLGRRHFPGAPGFYYGAYAAVGRDTEGDTSPMLKAETGWYHWNGWGMGMEVGRTWGREYEETAARARLEYLF